MHAFPRRLAVVVSVAVAVVVLGAPRLSEPEASLRVATYNIHHAVGRDGRLDLTRVAEEIRALRADAVGLQEVDQHWGPRSGFADQVGVLAASLDMRVLYAPNLDLPAAAAGHGTRRRYGLAILTSRPVVDSRHTLLPRSGVVEQRGLLEAVLSVPGGRVRLVTTHLEHRDRSERLRQARAVRAALRERGGPVVVTGDLNAVPESVEVGLVGQGLVDAWAGAGRGSGATVVEPPRRIDYVLHSPDLRVRSVEVAPGQGSDHRPVVAELLLPHAEVVGGEAGGSGRSGA